MTIEANELGIPEDAMRRLAEMRPGEPGGLFTSDLSVNEFLLVREAGFRPLGLVLGSSIYHVGLQIGRWSQNMELDTLSQAMYHARELAMSRMEAEADALGADGIVGVRLEIEFKEFGNDLAEFIAVGTAVKSDVKGNWRNDENKPFTSDLSGQDFWTLIQAGYAPLGMVMGSCVYHIAHQGALKAMGNVGRNVEIPKFTEALYDARELAMSRMQAEAEQLKAEGIVGVQLLSLAHKWGGHTTEFFAIGTAVRPLRADHIIAKPQMVLPTDRPVSSEIVPGAGGADAGNGEGSAELPVERDGDAAVVDLVAAAIRADTADLDAYHRVLSATVSDLLPVGMVEVDRERTMKDRMAGREGRATSIRIRLGDRTLELVTRHGGLVATVAREVRGVVISRQEISVAEWTQLLAQYLAQLAAESADARLALSKLLGEA